MLYATSSKLPVFAYQYQSLAPKGQKWGEPVETLQKFDGRGDSKTSQKEVQSALTIWESHCLLYVCLTYVLSLAYACNVLVRERGGGEEYENWVFVSRAARGSCEPTFLQLITELW